MASEIEWIGVDDYANRRIGAVGFIDGKLAIVGAFHDDKDGDLDSKVSVLEYAGGTLFSNKGVAVARVANQAQYMTEVLNRDADAIIELAAASMMRYFGRMVGEAVYNVYFKRSVRSVAGAAASLMVTGAFKQFVVRKGMEGAIKRAYESGFAAA